MARQPISTNESVTLLLPQELRDKLYSHLFPGDHDEHAAVIAAGIAESARSIRLTARQVFLAVEGKDYVPGIYGYKMLQPQFIYENLHYCREHQLCYLAVHNHGGDQYVAFSDIDLESHERGYPALLDIQSGLPVGALVFAPRAAAGDIWFSRTNRRVLRETRVIGTNIARLYPEPSTVLDPSDSTYDRQVLLFGREGQSILAKSKVGVIGAGGVGSLLVEYLAHLGVGELLVVDNKRIAKSNRSRVVGATTEDIHAQPPSRKIDIAERVALSANANIKIRGIFDNFAKDSVARQFADCDFLFLSADSMQARLVFNALVHQYLIPGIQTGAKVQVSEKSGEIHDIFSVVRWVLPESGCLWCNGLIPRDLLAMEAKDPAARKEQTYGTSQENPSVITLNAVTAGHAANDFMMAFLGLLNPHATVSYQRYKHRERGVFFDLPRRDPNCTECGLRPESRRACGDAIPLPTIPS